MCNKHNLLLVLEMENGMALRIVQVIEPGDFRNIARSHGRQDRAKGRTGGIFPVSRPGQENVPVSFMSRHVKRIILPGTVIRQFVLQIILSHQSALSAAVRNSR